MRKSAPLRSARTEAKTNRRLRRPQLDHGGFEVDRHHRLVVAARVIAGCDLRGLQYGLHLGRFHLSVPGENQGKAP